MKSLRFLLLATLAGIAMMPQTADSQTLDRTKRPVPLPAPEVKLPALQRCTLSNGLNVILVEKHNLPTVAFNMVVLAGSDHDSVTLPGLASMTAETMDAGSTSMDALKISERLEFIGASMSIRAGVDASSAFLQTLTKHLDEALAVYSEVLTGPTFPAKEFERLRNQRITSLMQQRDRAAVIATLVFNKLVYGDHPYGNDPLGTEVAIRAMSREDLQKFYATYYRPDNATLIVVGDVSQGTLVPKLERAFASWKNAKVPTLTFPAIKAVQPGKVYLVDKLNAPQSEIRIGYPALARSTPDYFPVIVMNRVLGGQFSSRINLNLRERRGFTYGARSAFTFTRQPGPFVASGGFVSAKTDSSIEELLHELTTMFKAGLTAEELAFSKNGLVGSFAQSFETQGQIAMALQSLVLYGLPDDYFQNYLKNIEKVSLEDVRRVAAAYLDASKMAIVVVGDVKTIRPGIEKLAVGTISLCDTQGNVLGQ